VIVIILLRSCLSIGLALVKSRNSRAIAKRFETPLKIGEKVANSERITTQPEVAPASAGDSLLPPPPTFTAKARPRDFAISFS
jgi:hypothetical protein